MAGGQKKVVVRHLDGRLMWGYLPTTGFVQGPTVELMGADGRITSLQISEIRTIAYVRDFNLDDPSDPERMGRKTFLGRPRMSGIWLRLTFLDDSLLEGLTDLDLGALTAIAEAGGVTLTPPDGRGNTLRVFVPATALRAVEVLGWISTAKKPDAPKKPAGPVSGDLFGPPSENA